ncbi:MAG: DUF5602 domain-containing protein [Armatimonadota bacterium]
MAKFTVRLLFLFLSLILCVSNTSYSQVKSANTKIYNGKAVRIGDGNAHTWVKADNKGKPVSMGISFTKEALTGLPAVLTEYLLPLPTQITVQPYNHATIDWNPHGHIPAGIYDKPHFDYHFYIINSKERESITATGEDLARVEMKPESRYIPKDYISTPGGVPHMGAHWVDPSSPELNGKPFDKTFIYGFYAGGMVFLEPMVTLEYLNSHKCFNANVKQPVEYQKSGYYPIKYGVLYSSKSGMHTISLDNLVYRQQK